MPVGITNDLFKRVAAVAALFSGLTFSQIVLAAGFQISEQSLVGMGRAFAGAGVSGDDASDMFYNPAGLMLNENRQVQIGVTAISPSAKFENQGSTQRFTTASGAVIVPSRGTEDDGGDDALVPNFYYAFPRMGNIRFGVGVSAPFGLATEYDKNWVGRYHALKSELKTVDINPTIGYQVSDKVAIGGGINIQKADATLSQAVFLGPDSPIDGKATATADDTSVGYNLGIMIGDEDARVGLGFRSKIEQEAKGDLRLVTGPRVTKVDAEATVVLPETVYLSGFKRLSDKVDLLGSVRWTNWSRFEELRIDFGGGLPPSITDESWEDTSTYSLGLNIRANESWTLRTGLAHDESPVPDEFHRTPRIPDTERDWVTFGASYRASDRVSVDFSYAHLFTDGSKVNNTIDLVSAQPGAFTDNLVGEFTDADADLLGIQILVDL